MLITAQPATLYFRSTEVPTPSVQILFEILIVCFQIDKTGTTYYSLQLCTVSTEVLRS